MKIDDFLKKEAMRVCSELRDEYGGPKRTQQEIAEIVGMSQDAICAYVNNVHFPSSRSAQKIVRNYQKWQIDHNYRAPQDEINKKVERKGVVNRNKMNNEKLRLCDFHDPIDLLNPRSPKKQYRRKTKKSPIAKLDFELNLLTFNTCAKDKFKLKNKYSRGLMRLYREPLALIEILLKDGNKIPGIVYHRGGSKKHPEIHVTNKRIFDELRNMGFSYSLKTKIDQDFDSEGNPVLIMPLIRPLSHE